MSRIVYKSNGGAIGDGIRVTRVSGAGQRLEVLVDPVAERWSEVALVADTPAPVPQPDPAPDPDPAPTPDPVPPAPAPTPPPAQPKPPAPSATYDMVAGLKDRSTPNGSPDTAGWKSIDAGDALPSGFTVTAGEIVNTGFSGDLVRWDIGARKFTNKAQMGRLQIVSRGPQNNVASVDLWPGSYVDSIEYCEFLGGFGQPSVPKCLHSRNSNAGAGSKIGSFGRLYRSRFEGFGYDLIKVCGNDLGECIIEENYFGPQVFAGGAPHFDGITIMAAHNAVRMRRNYLDMGAAAGQAGVNNWTRIEPYFDGARFDEIEFAENIAIHGNPTSYAIHVAWKNNPTWNGPLRFNGNWMRKAGGPAKVLYPGTASFMAEWQGNIDLDTGAEI